MASIRRYKLPKKYRDGGRVTADMVLDPVSDIPAVELAEERADQAEEMAQLQRAHAEELAVVTAEPEPEESPFVRAIAAQRHAEELARQRPAPSSIRANIKALESSDPFRYRAASFHYAQGLMEGIQDESPAMETRILAGIKVELAQAHEQAVENVHDRGRAILPPEPRVPSLSYKDVDPYSVIRPSPAPLPAPAMAAPRRSIPMSAPVSRDVPDASGKRGLDSRKVTLSPLEIDIARHSYTAEDMTNSAKELLYAKNKAKLARMRASGEYRQTTEQDG